MKVQYSRAQKSSKALLVEYHESLDYVIGIPCFDRDQAKQISWQYSVGVWRVKQTDK